MRAKRHLFTLASAVCLAIAPTVGAQAQTDAEGLGPTQDIVYQWVQGDGDGIFVMAEDGSGSRAILGDMEGSTFHPDWSPDGSRIAFELEDEDGWDVWTAAADGSDRMLLVDRSPCPVGDCLGVSNPAWSPDGESMAYVRFSVAPGDVLRSEVEVMDIASGETRVVASAEPGTVFEHPRWTPDGGSLIYTFTSFADTVELETHTGGGLAIAPTARSGVEPKVLTDPALFASYPDVRASDGLIVFNTYDLGEFKDPAPATNLYTMRADGSDLTQLTDFGPGEQRAGQPTWAPDGERIIFTVGGSHTPHAAFIDANGDGLTILDALATHPRLRPAFTNE